MKLSIFSLLLVFVFVFTSCEKTNIKCDKGDKFSKYDDKYDKDGDVETICTWDGSKVSDATIWDTYIDEALVTDQACGCIVSGVVKYAKKDGSMAYEIYYGKGECDEWAWLVTYYDEKGDKVEKCKFDLGCTNPEG